MKPPTSSGNRGEMAWGTGAVGNPSAEANVVTGRGIDRTAVGGEGRAITKASESFGMRNLDAVAARLLSVKDTTIGLNEKPTAQSMHPEGNRIEPLLARRQAIEDQVEPFKELREFRQREGLDQIDGAVAKLEIQGRVLEGAVFFGKNAHGENVLLIVNPGSRGHAETDVFNQAALSGLKGGDAHLIVDRELCGYCEESGAVKSLAKQLEFDSLIVTDPKGTRIVPLKIEQVGHAPKATVKEQIGYKKLLDTMQKEEDPLAEEHERGARSDKVRATRLEDRIAREESQLNNLTEERFTEAERLELAEILRELRAANRLYIERG